MTPLRAIVFAAPLAIVACTGPTGDPATTTPDAGRQLNDAAEMLDANSVSLNAINEDAR